MSSKSPGRIPKLRLHKPSGRVVVRLDGNDYYVGKFGSPESQDEYDRLIGEWMLRGRQAPSKPGRQSTEMSVGELIVAYVEHADGYYRKNGTPTGEYDCIRHSLKHLRRLYGTTSVTDFGPLALKNVREAMLNDSLCRPEINKRVLGWSVVLCLTRCRSWVLVLVGLLRCFVLRVAVERCGGVYGLPCFLVGWFHKKTAPQFD
jgi:hypothetical protein